MKEINTFTQCKNGSVNVTSMHAFMYQKLLAQAGRSYVECRWTFSIHSKYLLKKQSENKKSSWSVWINIGINLQRGICLWFLQWLMLRCIRNTSRQNSHFNNLKYVEIWKSYTFAMAHIQCNDHFGKGLYTILVKKDVELTQYCSKMTGNIAIWSS